VIITAGPGRRSGNSRLGGCAGEPGQERGEQGEDPGEERRRVGVQRVLGEQLGEVDAWAGYAGGVEDVEDRLGDDAVSGGGRVDGVQPEQAPLEPSGLVRAVEAGIEAGDGGGQRVPLPVLLCGAGDRIVEVAAVGNAVQDPAQVDQVPVAPVGAGPADVVLDGVVVLVDRRVDGPRLLMGDVAVLVGAEVLFDGLITNGKFCLVRRLRLSLTWWRRPLRLRASSAE
jgi:hypothetical protein